MARKKKEPSSITSNIVRDSVYDGPPDDHDAEGLQGDTIPLEDVMLSNDTVEGASETPLLPTITSSFYEEGVELIMRTAPHLCMIDEVHMHYIINNITEAARSLAKCGQRKPSKVAEMLWKGKDFNTDVGVAIIKHWVLFMTVYIIPTSYSMLSEMSPNPTNELIDYAEGVVESITNPGNSSRYGLARDLPKLFEVEKLLIASCKGPPDHWLRTETWAAMFKSLRRVKGPDRESVIESELKGSFVKDRVWLENIINAVSVITETGLI